MHNPVARLWPENEGNRYGPKSSFAATTFGKVEAPPHDIADNFVVVLRQHTAGYRAATVR